MEVQSFVHLRSGEIPNVADRRIPERWSQSWCLAAGPPATHETLDRWLLGAILKSAASAACAFAAKRGRGSCPTPVPESSLEYRAQSTSSPARLPTPQAPAC